MIKQMARWLIDTTHKLKSTEMPFPSGNALYPDNTQHHLPFHITMVVCLYIFIHIYMCILKTT